MIIIINNINSNNNSNDNNNNNNNNNNNYDNINHNIKRSHNILFRNGFRTLKTSKTELFAKIVNG